MKRFMDNVPDRLRKALESMIQDGDAHLEVGVDGIERFVFFERKNNEVFVLEDTGADAMRLVLRGTLPPQPDRN